MMIEQHDELEGYCRTLGHHLSFHYCRRLNQNLPCPRIRDCWFERLAIDDFLKAHYSAEERARIATPPAGKLDTILKLLAQG
jgi:hypothetical protein